MEPEVHEKQEGEKQIYVATPHVRSSPITQPTKALKQRVGQVLVMRESPCAATGRRCSAAADGRADRDAGIRGVGPDGV
jgi:hypothetical protein